MSGPLSYSVNADITKFESAMSRARDLALQRSAEMLKSFQSTAAGINTAMSGIQGLARLPGQLDTAKTAAIGLAATGAGILAAYTLVSSSISQANAQLDRFIKLGVESGRSGVGVEFFQRFSEAAEKAKLSTSEVEAALRKAGQVVTPKFEQEDPVKKQLNNVFETGYTGSYQSQGLADYNKASTNEGRIRAAVTAMQELRDLGLQVAAIDIAEKLFPEAIVERIRSGQLTFDAIATALDRKRDDLVKQEDVDRATEFRDRLDAAYKAIDDFFHVSVALEGTGRQVLDIWLGIAEGVAKATTNAGNFYTKIQEMQGPLADYLKTVGLIIGGTAKIFAEGFNDQIAGSRTIYDKPIGPERPGAPENAIKDPPAPPRRPLNFFTEEPKTGGGRSAKPAAPSESLDAVETYVNGLTRTTAALRAEVEAIGKSNAEKLVSVNLAKAQELATQNGLTLSAQQIATIKETSAATAQYRDKIEEVRDQHENLRSIGSSVLGGLVSDARNGVSAMQALTNAVGRLFDRLADQSVNSLVDSLFGKSGSTSGGVLSGLFSGGKGIDTGMGLPWLKFAEGGRISGPGSGTSDDILARVSNGEFVVKADATRTYLPLLEAMNSGKLPAFAVGGLVGAIPMPRPVVPSSGGGRSEPGGLSVTINEAPGGDKASGRMGRTPDGSPTLIIDMISRQQASDIASGRGPLSDVSPGARRLRG